MAPASTDEAEFWLFGYGFARSSYDALLHTTENGTVV
jgi:hypothetical protein